MIFDGKDEQKAVNAVPAIQQSPIAGVEIKVFVYGAKTEYVPDGHGFIGKLAPQKLRLSIRLMNADIEALSVIPEASGSHSVRFMKNHASENTTGPDRFAQRIQIHAGAPPHIAANQNHVILTEAFEGGRLRLHEIAIVGDSGEFFLTHQAKEAQVYRDGYRLALPMRPSWRFERGMLEEILGSKAMFRPRPISDYHEASEPSVNGLGDNEAVVDWWSDAKGRGEIITNKRHHVIVRLGSFAVRKSGRLNTLSPGQKVSFESILDIMHHGRYSFDQAFGLSVIREKSIRPAS